MIVQPIPGACLGLAEVRLLMPRSWRRVAMKRAAIGALLGGLLLTGSRSADYPDNDYLTERPTGAQVFVRPNQYQEGRANLTIFNWDEAASVGADVSEVLSDGDEFGDVMLSTAACETQETAAFACLLGG